MSWRIEHADPLSLLSELPGSWAQTCFTSPPCDLPVPYLLAALGEVHRILRSDGTLWLSLARAGNTHELWRALDKESCWLRPLPASAAPRRVLLLAKQPGFLFRPKRPASRALTAPCSGCRRCPSGQRFVPGCRVCRAPRRAWCVPSPDAAWIPPRKVIDWCISASTVQCACPVCGAPCRPSTRRTGQAWRSTCAHKGGRGRCLVIDPFCETAETGIVAINRGHHYLGITPSQAGAEAARQRLAKLSERVR